MNTWILVMVILTGYGVAIQDIEFSSKEACQKAAIEMKAVETRWDKKEPYLVCLSKGENQ